MNDKDLYEKHWAMEKTYQDCISGEMKPMVAIRGGKLYTRKADGTVEVEDLAGAPEEGE